ncbi:MAG: laminin B domain-containing protein [Planctomycetota bacterium]
MHLPAAVLSVAATAASAHAVVPTIASTFDTGPEGWGTLNSATGFGWDPALGSPGGAIHARDQGFFDIWYYAASDAYSGDLTAYYDGAITWDTLGIEGDQSLASRADVMIFGGGLGIGVNIAASPERGTWVTRSVTLTQGDWFIVGSANEGALIPSVATEQEIMYVLSNVDGFFLQGEYTDGADETAIDNVFLTAFGVPSPGALAFLGLATLATRRRR